ncbi:J domain-containing protein [Halopenitus persicus]|uniref:J domain-containing protein n=1 Tax=Halopenitus persicus TaxID=1048396 RepID=UPI000BBA6221|nr:J domain-containing protein [Halopenitus persicus]
MVERSGHSVYFSDDLRERVSNWADNSTSSQADIIDKALEDFFDRHTITEDGTIVSDDANSRNTGQNDAKQEELLQQILDNQEEMLSSINAPSEKNGADIFSDDREASEEVSADEGDEPVSGVPDTPQVTDVEEQIVGVSGEYQHDEAIDPDEVATIDVSSSTVVKEKPDHLIPAVVGMLNHEYPKWVDWSDIEELIVGALGMSASTARNYRSQMIRQGVLLPHPSVDDGFVGDGMVKTVKTHAAKESKGWVNSYEDIDNPDRFADDVEEYITEYVSGWNRDGSLSGEYCVDEEAYVEELWRIVAEASETMAGMHTGTRSWDGMSDSEKMSGASRVVTKLAGRLGELTAIDGNRLKELVSEGSATDGRDEYREWMLEWAEFREGVRETLYDVDTEENLDEAEAREVLGVNEDASNDEIRETYEEYVLDNHPDAGGSDEEIDPDEFHEVLEAKRVLTA